MTPQEFVAKWKNSELKERSSYQEHFIDICRLIDHPTPAEMDPKGTFYTFEAGASKATGGEGFADVWYADHFAWEYKGKHADLTKAYSQLLNYKDALRNPPLLITSDFETIHIHTNFTNTVKQELIFSLDDLINPRNLTLLQSVFLDPEGLQPHQTTQQVTEDAAINLARLSDRLRNRGIEPILSSRFLIQLLFCLFSEDAGLIPNKLFTRLVENARRNPEMFNKSLSQLFEVMAIGGYFGVEKILHFDGHLFENAKIVNLSVEEIAILRDICSLDWSQIEPSIFGTLFERSLDPSKRSQLGAHYTSKEDILLIIEPVIMEPLRAKWIEVKDKAIQISQDRNKIIIRSAQQTKDWNILTKELTSTILGFSQELAEIKILDPACGSGNFLYVALKQLLGLWKEVSNKAKELGLPLMMPYTTISPTPEQLFGIEVNVYAHQLAQATIWIGYIQWLQENGFGFPPEPILKPLDNIINKDAVLAYDSGGNPIESEWPEADIIIGNPPFLGSQKMIQNLGEKYTSDLRRLFDNRLPACDLCCFWFEKSRYLLESKKIKRVGLLATQAIRGGANRTVLNRINDTGNIFFAYSDRNWFLDGASVHISMVGFDDGSLKEYFLDNKKVDRIFADLSSDIDLTNAETLPENSRICFQGPVKVGTFEISNELAQQMLNAQNPNGRSNQDVIKPWLNGSDITGVPRNMYIIDFSDYSEKEAELYELPFEYVVREIKPSRLLNRDHRRRENWWKLGASGAHFKSANRGNYRYIVTPRVSKHRIFDWVSGITIPDSAIVAFTRNDDYFFGILHSRIHELWARNMGTQLREEESGFRYTPRSTFETFPLPWPPGQEPKDDERVNRISLLARRLVRLRNNWLRNRFREDNDPEFFTLTNLYNTIPSWLRRIHIELDQAVLIAYGWESDISENQILEKLLELNYSRSQTEPN
ncbi:MAG: class I SAM-dependent DNA methyltransferase [Deltaproteobacteria bacterium]|nr:class I SAM-dependent DNA methyltransferase [Deltaproteobacteria bacterium]